MKTKQNRLRGGRRKLNKFRAVHFLALKRGIRGERVRKRQEQQLIGKQLNCKTSSPPPNRKRKDMTATMVPSPHPSRGEAVVSLVEAELHGGSLVHAPAVVGRGEDRRAAICSRDMENYG